MQHDPTLKPGFYWVRFEGELIIAQYTTGKGCVDEIFHWHVPGSEGCFMDVEISERMSGPLAVSDSLLLGADPSLRWTQ